MTHLTKDISSIWLYQRVTNASVTQHISILIQHKPFVFFKAICSGKPAIIIHIVLSKERVAMLGCQRSELMTPCPTTERASSQRDWGNVPMELVSPLVTV